MRSPLDCALDLQKALNEDGIHISGWNAHSSDAEIDSTGLSIIEEHMKRVIREAREDERQKAQAA
jgi:hypothetical protein